MRLQTLKLITLKEQCNLKQLIPDIPDRALVTLLPQRILYATGVEVGNDKLNIPIAVDPLNQISMVKLGIYTGGRNKQVLLGTLNHRTGSFSIVANIVRIEGYLCVYY